MSVRRPLDRHHCGRVALMPETADAQEHAMPNYMLLLHRISDQPLSSSPDEMMAITKDYMTWAEKMRAEGRLKGGDKLTNDAGKVMRVKDGRVTVTDGPYAESKEILGGYFAISAKDYDEACSLAESCPHLRYGGRIEVRQVEQM
jgi:hypothetical protein